MKIVNLFKVATKSLFFAFFLIFMLNIIFSQLSGETWTFSSTMTLIENSYRGLGTDISSYLSSISHGFATGSTFEAVKSVVKILGSGVMLGYAIISRFIILIGGIINL